MSKKNKSIVIITIITCLLVVTLGITYAAFTYNKTGGNSQLVLGDIYMHYKETNQLTIENAMPQNGDKYYQSVLNTNMTEEELNKCVTYLTGYMGAEKDGESYENFCNGTGTVNGFTFQALLILGDFDKEAMVYFEKNNIIQMKFGSYKKYIHNTNMTDEELNKCVTYMKELGGEENLPEGESIEAFCNGTGTLEGLTLQQALDAGRLSSSPIMVYFEKNNIIKAETYTLPYFEFIISGKNTYEKKDIWYEIVLSHGDNHDTRNTRLLDKFLKFSLVEIKDGKETVVLNNRSYSDLTNKRIWIDTIPKNTTSQIVHTYRLYMWISDQVKIGNTSETDYDTETWNNQVYASIKVGVTGDFNEKTLSNEFRNVLATKLTTITDDDGTIYISGPSYANATASGEIYNEYVDYNYVWYSEKLWRITAIHPDGTIKMVTDDIVTTINYGENVNFYTNESRKSYIYQWLNNDFLDTLVNSENIIVGDSKWNVGTTGSISTKPGTDNMITSPVGLLNSYEYYVSYESVKSVWHSYLVIYGDWWLLNPNSSSDVWYVKKIGSWGGPISSQIPGSSSGVRPSINIKSTVKINGGDGSKENPFKVSET